MSEFEIDVADLGDRRAPTRPAGQQPAKYRDPESGKTWSGRGQEPAWNAGKDRSAFEI
nr:H-NS histone family protein [Burkholderia gladioli]